MDIASFDLNLLKSLDALLREPTVTAAGRRAGLSQPAMSAALSRLRLSFGDPLLVRRGGGMSLTPFARTLAPKVEAAMQEISTALARPSFDPATAERTFRVAATDQAVISIVQFLLPVLAREAPGATVAIRPIHQPVGPLLAAGDLDLALAADWTLRDCAHRRELYRDDYAALARHDHPRLPAAPTLRDYVAEAHILVSPQGRTSGVVDTALARVSETRRIAVFTPEFSTAPMLLSATDYILTLPTRLAAWFAPRHGLRAFPVPVDLAPTVMSLATGPSAARDPGVTWLIERILAIATST